MHAQDRIVHIPDTATDRYATLELIPWWRQDVVRNATVMVVGAGALGNEVIKNLTLLGVGRLVIIDFDTIEDANLSRSVLFGQGDRGRRKAEVAAESVKRLNPDVQTLALHADINSVGLGLFRRMDVVIGCLDNRQARLAVNRACWHVDKPWVDGAIQDLYGEACVFWPGRGACYECTLTEHDWRMLAQRHSCPWLARRDILQGKVPTTPVIASIIAAIQVQEALKLLHGMPVAAGKSLIFDGRANEFLPTDYSVRSECQSHWRYDEIIELPLSTAGGTLASEWMRWAEKRVGEGAIVELEHELVTNYRCSSCDATESVLLPLEQIDGPPTACAQCGGPRTFDTTHDLAETIHSQDRTLAELGVPPLHVLAVRKGSTYFYCELTGDLEDVLRFR